MTPGRYIALSADQLVELFVEKTMHLGGFMSFPPKTPFRSPERDKLTAEIKAIAAELSRRKDVDALMPLFNHENPDVRFWAGTQFMSANSEWALAAFSSALEDLPTRDILALTRRARELPPSRPTLQEMSVKQLVDRFEDACMRHYGVRYLTGEDGGPCYSAISRVSSEIGRVVGEIENRDAVSQLLPLLDHKNVVVRRCAAQACLPIAEAHATAVLEAIAQCGTGSEDAVEAADALQHWRGEGVYGSLPRH
ncbi:MAG: DUF2019 domain-containing protein [Alphaproteobacteria bacterium]|nr:DUF2019 domain-containing protein [Alphaproteobacteria bacterium]